MSSPNVELVQALYAAWERGDFSSAEWADPEIDFELADGPSPGSWRGLSGLAKGYREWLSGWEDVHVWAEEIFELDDERVVALVRGSGHGRTSGLKMEQFNKGGVNVFSIRGGKVTRLVLYYDRDRALADLGLDQEASS